MSEQPDKFLQQIFADPFSWSFEFYIYKCSHSMNETEISFNRLKFTSYLLVSLEMLFVFGRLEIPHVHFSLETLNEPTQTKP